MLKSNAFCPFSTHLKFKVTFQHSYPDTRGAIQPRRRRTRRRTRRVAAWYESIDNSTIVFMSHESCDLTMI